MHYIGNKAQEKRELESNMLTFWASHKSKDHYYYYYYFLKTFWWEWTQHIGLHTSVAVLRTGLKTTF